MLAKVMISMKVLSPEKKYSSKQKDYVLFLSTVDFVETPLKLRLKVLVVAMGVFNVVVVIVIVRIDIMV